MTKRSSVWRKNMMTVHPHHLNWGCTLQQSDNQTEPNRIVCTINVFNKRLPKQFKIIFKTKKKTNCESMNPIEFDSDRVYVFFCDRPATTTTTKKGIWSKRYHNSLNHYQFVLYCEHWTHTHTHTQILFPKSPQSWFRNGTVTSKEKYTKLWINAFDARKYLYP